MSDPWKPDSVWSADEVREVIRAQTEMACKLVEPLGSGWTTPRF